VTWVSRVVQQQELQKELDWAWLATMRNRLKKMTGPRVFINTVITSRHFRILFVRV
jgi:hypothetical protein